MVRKHPADMTVTKETVPLDGTLKGERHERTCRVRATRCVTYPDESPDALCVSYSRCDIEDEDDFPDGNYELTFQGHTVLLTKCAGHYGLR